MHQWWWLFMGHLAAVQKCCILKQIWRLLLDLCMVQVFMGRKDKHLCILLRCWYERSLPRRPTLRHLLYLSFVYLLFCSFVYTCECMCTDVRCHAWRCLSHEHKRKPPVWSHAATNWLNNELPPKGAVSLCPWWCAWCRGELYTDLCPGPMAGR